ncbi:hypothetical protein GQ53DRAFT_822667 [Thozetella sp. PMI_491]|nr:hypothetical protein GQ53DRAFT_822667 [Thozetella sp. PMI_491]
MDDPFAFWYPDAWTTVGAIFTILSFLLALVVAVSPDFFLLPRRNPLRWDRRDDQATAALSPLEALTRDVEVLRKALAPLGEPIAEILRDNHSELKIKLQELESALCEVRREVQGLRTDAPVPAPELLEILSELRLLKQEGVKIQRGNVHLSLANTLGRAPAADLARKRIQAYFPSPFRDVD